MGCHPSKLQVRMNPMMRSRSSAMAKNDFLKNFKVGEDLLDAHEAAALLSIHVKTFYKWTSEKKDFPRAIEFSPRMKRWKKSEITTWVESLGV